MQNGSRVAVPKTTISEDLEWLVATNLLQGDHAVAWILPGNLVAATFGSHKVGNPRMTLAMGLTCGPYSLRTIDSLGHRRRAEW